MFVRNHFGDAAGLKARRAVAPVIIEDDLLTAGEASDLARCSYWTIINAMQRGDLPDRRDNANKPRFDPQEVLRWARDRALILE